MDTEIQVISSVEDIKNKVHMIRGQQVMLDYDLAKIYGYEVKRLNEQVKRNISRFPEDFMFQLVENEIPDSLKSQFATLNDNGNKRGMHIKKMPYAFTEQGIYMLATVLRGELAEQQSIFIMRAFKEMRHFIANNALMFERINGLELRQLEYQKDTDEKFGRIFAYMADHEEDNQKIFYDGQIFDAFSLLTDMIRRAKKEIILVDLSHFLRILQFLRYLEKLVLRTSWALACGMLINLPSCILVECRSLLKEMFLKR